MYSTTTLIKNSRFSGKIIGTHQQLNQEARRALSDYLPRGTFFPSSKTIIHFEGSRGPDGLKRKSPGNDEPSHMMLLTPGQILEIVASVSTEISPTSATGIHPESSDPAKNTPQTNVDTPKSHAKSQPSSYGPSSKTPSRTPPDASKPPKSDDSRSVPEMIVDHRWNLVQALRRHDATRAAFEAAWMAHMIVDGLTPAHHFPLSDVKDQLMTSEEMMHIFGQPVKGVIRGRSLMETVRNNWLYWGAKGFMSQHVAYEYGVAMIAATLPHRTMASRIDPQNLFESDFWQTYCNSVKLIQQYKMYERFCQEGWTTELAYDTKNILLPEIVKNIAAGWYSAIQEAYDLPKTSLRPLRAPQSDLYPEPSSDGAYDFETPLSASPGLKKPKSRRSKRKNRLSRLKNRQIMPEKRLFDPKNPPLESENSASAPEIQSSQAENHPSAPRVSPSKGGKNAQK